jgi:hypothetical protein
MARVFVQYYLIFGTLVGLTIAVWALEFRPVCVYVALRRVWKILLVVYPLAIYFAFIYPGRSRLLPGPDVAANPVAIAAVLILCGAGPALIILSTSRGSTAQQ